MLTDDPEVPQVTLSCESEIKGVFQGAPPQIRFPQISRDAGPQSQTANLARGTGGPIKPELIPPLPPGIEAKIDEALPGEHYRLHVTLAPPWPSDRIRQSIKLKTGVEEVPFEFVPVSAEVEPLVRVLPGAFAVQRGQKESAEQAARLIWHASANSKAVSVSVNEPQLSARIVDSEGGQQVVLSVPADFHPRLARMSLEIKTDNPMTPRLEIPIQVAGMGRGVAASPLTPGTPGTPAARLPVRPAGSSVKVNPRGATQPVQATPVPAGLEPATGSAAPAAKPAPTGSTPDRPKATPAPAKSD